MSTPFIYSTKNDKSGYEKVSFEDRLWAYNTYEMLVKTVQSFANKPAVSFQMFGKPSAKSATLSWQQVLEYVNQTANALRKLGVTAETPVGVLLPNCPEMAVCLLAGQVAGAIVPINPMLKAENIAALLVETKVKVLVSLTPFPKTDLAAKARKAAEIAQIDTLLEIDLKRYASAALQVVIPFIRPKTCDAKGVKVLDFHTEVKKQNKHALDFSVNTQLDTIAAYFHTGGTTGDPKVAAHSYRGMLFNALVVRDFLLSENSTILCPLPLFHVLAAYPMWLACVASGAHLVLPTPMGYRGSGVIDNFWKLCEKWRVTFICAVPTALSTLLQKPVDADISTVRYALCGSAPMPVETFKRFESTTNIKILEGYGQTETTCLISCNPVHGERKIGSVGLVFPYTDVRIATVSEDLELEECATGQVGEILVRGPQVIPGYCQPEKNKDLFVDGYIRTGDRGRLDEDGYLWITGRAKDLIIRGGHNIDPGMIEEALAHHPDVVVACAVGQPDAHAGEVPCAYVEVREGATVTTADLLTYAREHIAEQPARPVYVEIVPELPKTTVGKIYKPEIRKRAIERVFADTLEKANISADIKVVAGTSSDFMVEVTVSEEVTRLTLCEILDNFTQPWVYLKK